MARRTSCRICGAPAKCSVCGDCKQAASYANPQYLANHAAMVREAQPWIQYGPGVQCCICPELITTLDQLSVEHIVPLREGGTHDKGNLGYAHRRCNSGMKAVTSPRLYHRPQ